MLDIMLNFFNKLKKNNKGMSLVEAVVAVAILSAATVPILAVLTSTVRYNAVAKVKQRATNTGMSIMETYKAYGIDGATNRLGFTDTFDGTTNTHNISGTVNFSDSDTKNYNVSILVEPTEHLKLIESGPDAGKPDITYIYNTRLDNLEGTPFFNPQKDAVFTEDSDIYNPYFYIRDLTSNLSTYYGTDIDSESIKNIKLYRDIYIEVDKLAEDSFAKITYKIHGTYNLGSKLILRDAALSLKDEVEVDVPVISAGDSTVLNNLFLYYYPAYSHSATIDERSVKVYDRLFIKDKRSAVAQNLNIYLFRQKDNSINDTKLKNYETAYDISIMNDTSVSRVNLYNVITKNLGDMSESKNLFSDGSSDTNIVSFNGMTQILKDEILSYKITVNITDPAPIFNSSPDLASFKGTLLL